MRAVILSIGDEILNGTTINTNASFISTQIQPLGIDIYEVLAISDNADHILPTLSHYTEKVDFVFITGGLGPTKDDITKKTLCTYFNSTLVFHEDILIRLKAAFAKRNIPFTENNNDQAMYPDNCIILKNNLGTAQGMWFQKNKTVFISLPGVPFEMKGLITEEVIPKLKKDFQFPIILNKHIMTSGMSESLLAKKIESIESNLPQNVSLAFLPSPGVVKLRLTAKGNNQNELEKLLSAISSDIKLELGNFVFGEEAVLLEEFIGSQLKDLHATISTAESCTGGKIAQKLTSIPGASEYFKGAIVSYTTEVKMKLLHVKEETLQQFGPVSEQTVNEMLDGAHQTLNSDFVIAVSGNAGPGSDGDNEPVGTIFVGVSGRGKKSIKKYFFNKNRDINIEYACMFALHDMRILLTECLG